MESLLALVHGRLPDVHVLRGRPRLSVFIAAGLVLAAFAGQQAVGQVISLNASESSSYTKYTQTMMADSSTTWLSFFFRHDPSWWGFDDVSFVSTTGSTNLVTNPGFESGLFGWSLVGQQGLGAAGYVRTGSPGSTYTSPRSGSKWWYDGAVAGADGVAQAVATTPGVSYTLSFYLAGASGGGPGSSSVLFKAYAGNQVLSAYQPQFTQVSTGTVISGTVSAQSGQQLNIATANGGTINTTAGYASVASLAGATLTTGSYGADITTFSAGTLNTSQNSTVNVGTFSSGAINAAANSTVAITTMQSGDVFTSAGSRVTVGTLNSGSFATAPGSSITVTQGGDFTGSISGSGSLVMRGSETLTLNAANTFSGGTEISGGMVSIAAGNAIGSAPIRLVNNGRFRAMTNVDVSNQIVSQSQNAIYDHVFDTDDSLTNFGSFAYEYSDTSAFFGAGNNLQTTGTVSAQYAWDGTLSLEGLDGSMFLLVMDMDGLIPAAVSADDYYLGWFDTNDSTWKRATLGNYGPNGELAGGYAGLSYQQFLSNNNGWDGARMLGAYGVDWVNDQVWAVIDHNSEFGVALDGEIRLVPEPSSYLLAGLGIAGGWWQLRRRRASANAAAA
jgi:autotransporter-associated beta strand protein